jgi:hypothetical protein
MLPPNMQACNARLMQQLWYDADAATLKQLKKENKKQ